MRRQEGIGMIETPHEVGNRGMTAPSSSPSMLDKSWAIMTSIPLLEGTIFVVLATITIFRKQLSSNDRYRSDHTTKKTSTARIPVISTPSEDEPNVSLVDYFPSGPTTSFVHIFNDVTGNSFKRSSSFNIDNKLQGFTLTTLSHDSLLHIVEMLDFTDIIALSSVNRRLRSTLNEDWVWAQLWRVRYLPMWQHPKIVSIREKRSILWDPTKILHQPKQGWKDFYRQFEFCWIDWLLAGACSEHYCLLALFGCIIDATKFLPIHPGSLESLSDYAGGDSTSHFLDIGHSTQAYHLACNYVIYESPNTRHTLSYRTNAFEQKLSNKDYDGSIFQKRRITKFDDKMRIEGMQIAKNCDSRSSKVSFTSISSKIMSLVAEKVGYQLMIPTVRGHHNCLEAPVVSHCGQSRPIWDPLEERWYVWWTCCGYGKHLGNKT